uniref:Family with sequence similarity 110 member D n=1 Tax=Varanus komodoensis TaxID=61221 RepID=A0A8D2KU46_VARKO
MRPLSPGDGASQLGLLLRGPDYLRKQLEVSSGGRTLSAVERLEADKAKYVKSQQFSQGLVVGQDSLGPKKLPPPSPPPQSPIARRAGSRRMLRPDSLVIYRQKKDCSAVNKENGKGYGLVRRLFQGPLREGLSSHPSPRGVLGDGQLQGEQREASMVWAPAEREKTRVMRSVGILANSSCGPSRTPLPTAQLETDAVSPSSGPGLKDSKRELGLSYSLPLSEKERFFNYCGLDRNLVEVLGEERFKPGSWEAGSSCLLVGSVGSATSEHAGPSHNGEDLSTEELSEKLPALVSVVERNARVIKWLYSCQQARTVAKESTV